LVQVTAPAAPAAGVVHEQPAGGVRERKFAPAGMVMLTETLAAALGPLFVATAVAVENSPGESGFGLLVIEIATSADPAATTGEVTLAELCGAYGSVGALATVDLAA